MKIIQPLEKILLAEGDPDVQEITTFALRSSGPYTVEVCCTGRELLERIDEIDPQLILLDVMMPGMDGITTLKELRKIPRYIEIPVIFFSARDEAEDIAKYVNSGVSNVIPKPFDPLLLSDIIEDVWSKWYSGRV